MESRQLCVLRRERCGGRLRAGAVTGEQSRSEPLEELGETRWKPHECSRCPGVSACHRYPPWHCNSLVRGIRGRGCLRGGLLLFGPETGISEDGCVDRGKPHRRPAVGRNWLLAPCGFDEHCKIQLTKRRG